MKSLIGNAILLGLAGATALVVGCSSSSSPTSPGTGSNTHPGASSGEVGQLGLALSLPDGTQLSTVNYTLTNGTTVVQSGPLNTMHSQGIAFTLGQIPAASGYTLTLTSASDDGGITCLGTAGPFAVVAHAQVNETVNIVCQTAAPNVGIVNVNANENFCGTWTSLETIGPGVDAASTNGSEVFADNSSPIVITAQATGAAPASLVYTWTATTVSGNGVTIRSNVGNGTTSDTLTVTCNTDTTDTQGSATLTLVVTDSLDGGAVTCPSQLSTVSTTVFCDKAASCAAPTTNCGAAGTLNCVNLQTDPNNCGTCGTVVPAGDICVGGAPVCPAGSGICGGACVPLNTNTNCGACGIACTGTNVCNANPDGGTATCGAPNCNGNIQCLCNQYITTHEAGNTTSTTCSQTEALLFQKDQTGTCLSCALHNSYIDDKIGTGDANQECDDPTTIGRGTGTAVSQCITTLGCELGVNPLASPGPGSGSVRNAYCGGAAFSVCQAGSPAGACITQIVAGLPATDATSAQIISDLGNPTLASGRAGAMVANFDSSTPCATCVQ